MLKKIIFFCITLLSVVSTQVIVNASDLSFTYGVQKETGSLAKGITYERFTAVTNTDAGTSGNQNISYVKASNTAKIVSYAKLSTSGIKGDTVINLVKDYELKNPGYSVIAAINADYFYSSSGIFYPINSYVENGKVIKYSNHAKYMSLAFNSSLDYKVTKQNTITTNFYLNIYDSTGLYKVKSIPLQGKNTTPSDNETAFYYKNSTVDSYSDVKYFEVKQPDEYFNLASIYIKGKVTGQIQGSNTNPIVATKNKDVAELLSTNPVIEIQAELSDDFSNYSNYIGIGSQPLKEGTIQTVEQIGDQSASFTNARHPRTSLGFSKNGEIIFATIDGRQANMDGASLREEAQVMKELGCYNCFNFDGGGSTQLVIKENGTFRYLNQPSETYRSVVNAMLIVVPDVDVKVNLKMDEAKNSIEYSFDTVLNNGATLKEVLVYFDGNKVTETKIENIKAGENHFISFVAKYEKNSKEYLVNYKTEKVLFGSENIPDQDKRLPSNFTVEFNETTNGFDATIKCEDFDKLLSKVYLVNNNQREIAIKDQTGYVVNYKNMEPGEYTFQIVYYYKDTPVSTKEVVLTEEYTYTYKIESEDSSPKPTKCNSISLLQISYLSLFNILICLFLKKSK